MAMASNHNAERLIEITVTATQTYEICCTAKVRTEWTKGIRDEVL
jgi:hypothetical protein